MARVAPRPSCFCKPTVHPAPHEASKMRAQDPAWVLPTHQDSLGVAFIVAGGGGKSVFTEIFLPTIFSFN